QANPVAYPALVSTTDPDALMATKGGGSARMAYYDNYLVDTSSRVILEVEATPALFHQETAAARRMMERSEKLGLRPKNLAADKAYGRSEEHTSELQSRSDLVCRLLLEKKKT